MINFFQPDVKYSPMKPLLPTASAAAALPTSSTHAVVAIALGPVGATVAAASDTNTDDKTQMLHNGSYADPIQRQGTPVTEMKRIVGMTPIPTNSLLHDPRNFAELHSGISAHSPRRQQQNTSATATATAPLEPDIRADVKIGDDKYAHLQNYISERLPAELKLKMDVLLRDLYSKRDAVNVDNTEKAKIQLQIDFLKALNNNITEKRNPYSTSTESSSVYEGYLYTIKLPKFSNCNIINHNVLMSDLIKDIKHRWTKSGGYHCCPCYEDLHKCVIS